MKQKLLAIIDNEFMSKTEKLDALRVHLEECTFVTKPRKMTEEEKKEFSKLNDKESK